MEKSRVYRMIEYVVLEDKNVMQPHEKLEALRELFIQEDLAKFSEEQEAKQE